MIIIKINQVPDTASGLKERTSRAWKANIRNYIHEVKLIAVHKGVILEEYDVIAVMPDKLQANRICFDLTEANESKLKGMLINYKTSNPCTIVDDEELGDIILINDTRYCTVKVEGDLDLETYRPVIQRIRVKKLEREEIRIAYYNIDEDGKQHFQPRPLDLEEAEMIALITQGVKVGVFTKEGLKSLRKIFNQAHIE